MSINSQITSTNANEAAVGRLAPSLLSVAFGIMMIGVLGFAQIDVVHNAAHDGRHAFAFPCH